MANETLNRFDLSGRICVITGGAGLLGPKHAEAILDADGRVILLDINKNALDKVVSDLAVRYPHRVWDFVVDITDPDQIRKIAENITSAVGDVSILINNAANNSHMNRGNSNFSRLENLPLEIWDNDFKVGVTGAFLMSREFGGRMAKNGGGVILNIASDLGVIAPDQRIYRKEGIELDEQPVKPITYSVVKHALIGLTKYLATYWADKGVRVNSISPGGVYNNQPENFVAKLTNLIPMGRMANIDEYKAAILFLCSDASSYMTGANLIIDGGRTCW